MSKIPCRKCPDCGLINDITTEECVCGEDISYIPQVLYETDELPAYQRGKVDETHEFYSQKCPACGAVNYSGDKESPVKRCFSCAKAKISAVEPILFKERTPKPEAPKDEKPKEEPEKTEAKAEPAKTEAAPEPKEEKPAPAEAIEQPQETKPEQHNAQPEQVPIIEESKNAIDELFEINEEPANNAIDELFAIEENVSAVNDAPEETLGAAENEDERKEWSFRLSDMDEFDSLGKDIVLTAVRYGVYSFTVTADMVKDKPYMLGRSAGEYEFLSKDPRVSGFHCTLFVNDGQWYIQDNNSTNGTFVDDTDLGEGGCTDLQNGDRIKLGHSADSMEFQVSFK